MGFRGRISGQLEDLLLADRVPLCGSKLTVPNTCFCLSGFKCLKRIEMFHEIPGESYFRSGIPALAPDHLHRREQCGNQRTVFWAAGGGTAKGPWLQRRASDHEAHGAGEEPATDQRRKAETEIKIRSSQPQKLGKPGLWIRFDVYFHAAYFPPSCSPLRPRSWNACARLTHRDSEAGFDNAE